MKWKMLFRVGLTVVVLVAIVLFYLNNVLHKNGKDKISELVRSENLAFEEALVRHGGHENGKQSLGHGEAEAKQPRQKAASNMGDDVGHDKGNSKDDVKEGKEIKGHPADEKGRKMPAAVHKDDGVAGRGGEMVAADGKSGAEVHVESAQNGATLGLQPVHRRVGKQVHTQVHVIHLSVVACGDRAEEVLVMLKSAVVLTTSTPLVLHIFADTELHEVFTKQLDLWPPEFLDRVEYRVYSIHFPPENAAEWRKLFKTCATQRLFIPSLLTDVDALIYVDTDVLFLSPLTKLWSFFSSFNKTQLVALSPEHEDTSTGWYNRFARHPYVPPLGVNSGVMLMNLTRLRQSTWLPSMVNFYKEYRLKITWGDQDLINIYFHYHPEELYIYTCDWNYRPDHCMYMSVCKPAEQHGAFVLHGSRRVMHNDKHPAFKAVYTAFKNYHLGQDLEGGLLENLKKNLQTTNSTPCGRQPAIFLRQVQEVITETKGQLS